MSPRCGGGVVDRPTASKGALVSTPISQRNPSDPEIHWYRKTLSVVHPGTGNKNAEPPDRTLTTIASFSDKSKSRLRKVAANAAIPLISQMALTYHKEWPTDGRICKKHLNAFLQWIRRNYPDLGYLWIMEFQEKNKDHLAPHYHLYLTIEPDLAIWQRMAETWVRITGGTDDALWWHGPKRGINWMLWDMGTAQYLAKYLDKERQKVIPDGYINFGRFWGNSKNITPVPLTAPLEILDDLSVIDESTGEIYGGKETVIRWLGRAAEKQTKGYSRFRKRAPYSSYSILDGVKIYQQVEDYFSLLNQRKAKNNGIHSRINHRAIENQVDRGRTGRHGTGRTSNDGWAPSSLARTDRNSC